jgi:hypothetical protein
MRAVYVSKSFDFSQAPVVVFYRARRVVGTRMGG